MSYFFVPQPYQNCRIRPKRAAESHARIPRHQTLTIQQILDAKQPDYPAHRRDATFKKAPRSGPPPAENLTLPLPPSED